MKCNIARPDPFLRFTFESLAKKIREVLDKNENPV